MNVYFKKIIVSLCIVCSFTMFIRPQPVKAIAVVDDFIIIGGVLIATSVVVSLMIKAGECSGYEVDTSSISNIKDYVKTKLLVLSAAELLKYFATSSDSSGKDYVQLTSEGYEWNKADVWPDIHDDPIYKFEHPTQTTTNTIPGTPKPYMLNGFYMKPYSVVQESGHVYDTFSVSLGNTLSFQFQNSHGTVVANTFTPTKDCIFKFVYTGQNSGGLKCAYSYDGGTTFNYVVGNISTAANDVTNIGYKTTTNTVYVPGASVVTNTGIETGVKNGEAIAVPISGQYSKDGTVTYSGAEGANASVVSGLSAKTLDSSKVDTGEATSTGTLWEQLWQWLTKLFDGIRAIPDSLIKWFTVDWDKVKLHINYLDIVKSHLKPIYDIFELMSNVTASIKDSDGKFYMVIPIEMGGDGEEQCVLDLSVGSVYINTARDIIKYGMWLTFIWYIFRKFDPKFSI